MCVDGGLVRLGFWYYARFGVEDIHYSNLLSFCSFGLAALRLDLVLNMICSVIRYNTSNKTIMLLVGRLMGRLSYRAGSFNMELQFML